MSNLYDIQIEKISFTHRIYKYIFGLIVSKPFNEGKERNRRRDPFSFPHLIYGSKCKSISNLNSLSAFPPAAVGPDVGAVGAEVVTEGLVVVAVDGDCVV